MTILGKLVLGSILICILDGIAEFIFPSLNNILFTFPVKGINLFSMVVANLVITAYLIYQRRQLRTFRQAAWQQDREVERLAKL
jgi:Ca2+/H+ antiporter